MSSQAFFWVNITLGLILVLLFLIGRRGFVAPSKLNLRKDLRSKAMAKVKNDVQFQSKSSDPFEANMKNLNIMFMYNGHSFDAYEVLGAPAGAGLEVVQKCYQQSLAQVDGDRDFIEAAWFAIKKDRS